MSAGTTSRPDRMERGAALVLMVVALPVLLMTAMLAIDLARAEFIGNSLQSSADALALAATTQMAQNLDSWKQAKRAAFAALRQSEIFGHDGTARTPGYFGTIHSYSEDPEEDGSVYRGVRYTIGNLDLTIERGFYGIVNSPEVGGTNCSYAFESLEGTSDSKTQLKILAESGDRCDVAPFCNIWEVANATRVTVEINGFSPLYKNLIPNLPIFRINRAATSADFEAVAAKPAGCPL